MTVDPKTDSAPAVADETAAEATPPVPAKPKIPAEPAGPELGGPRGPEPTRYGDWERKGRCVDF